MLNATNAQVRVGVRVTTTANRVAGHTVATVIAIVSRRGRLPATIVTMIFVARGSEIATEVGGIGIGTMIAVVGIDTVRSLGPDRGNGNVIAIVIETGITIGGIARY